MEATMQLDRSTNAARPLRWLAAGLLLAGLIIGADGPAGASSGPPAAAPPESQPALAPGPVPPALPLLAMADDDSDEGSDLESEPPAEHGKLEPRYQPREPQPKSWYNGSYIFGITRTIAASTMVPAAKVPLFVLSVPLDIAFLPFAAIGGLFG
jgi:hypothetical protein